MIKASGLWKTYRTEDHRVLNVLSEVSLQIDEGEFVSVVGKSGSGKTTLLSLLAGLDHPSRGTVELDGQRIDHLSEEELAPLRSKTIGFIFQSFHLVPTLSVLENVMIPSQLAGVRDAKEKALELIEKVGLQDRLGSRPSQLSGGEQQRVSICRALINQPRILFADEPTGNLDTHHGNKVMDLLIDLKANRTLVLVTHDRSLSERADRRIHLQDGRIVDEDTFNRQLA
jgi:putative ABC transport system ATP-binding protein